MTFPPELVGDKGQRYEVSATGYPKDGTSVIGWSGTIEGAAQLADAIGQAPGCTSTTIFDREEQKEVVTRFRGALR